MKILHHGNPDAARVLVQFICRNCGCVFEATRDECKRAITDIKDEVGVPMCLCPDCGYETWPGALVSVAAVETYAGEEGSEDGEN